MCNEREQLIGYVYDECEPDERAAVQQHLESCAECRTEIAALRSVRDDLQAWDVPDHESVWKPFTPAPAPAWWQQVPRWAMAAAAGAVIVSGAAGGAAAIAMMPPVLAAPVVASNAPAGATQVGLTENDLRVLEQRMEARIQAEVNALNGRLQLVSSRSVLTDSETLHASLESQIADLRAKSNKQLDLVGRINANFEQYTKSLDTRHLVLKNRVENVMSLLEQGR